MPIYAALWKYKMAPCTNRKKVFLLVTVYNVRCFNHEKFFFFILRWLLELYFLVPMYITR